MQLCLTMEEFELLKRLAEDEGRLSCDAMPSLPKISGESRLRHELEIGRDLVGIISDRSLCCGWGCVRGRLHPADLLGSRTTKRVSISRSVTECICLVKNAAAGKC